MSEAMNLQAIDLENLNQLYQMQSTLGNMYDNIILIEQGANGQIITVTNANLYQLAAKYYGDAQKWNAIAEANGLIDPVVQATISVSILSDDNQILEVTGIVLPSQTITIIIQNTLSSISTTYIYSIQVTDTLFTIAANIGLLIPGSVVFENLIFLPPYNSISINVVRAIQLTIPQSANDTGAILQI
jgi:hypothetical protein